MFPFIECWIENNWMLFFSKDGYVNPNLGGHYRSFKLIEIGFFFEKGTWQTDDLKD